MAGRELSTLQWALLASGAAHAVLLTVHLADPSRAERAFRDAPLEVILVNAKSSEAPEQALAIAQANLAGGGEVEKGRATSPLPMGATVQLGDAVEDSRRRIDNLQQEQQQLLTDMRRRIEERGTRDFPEYKGQKLYGELTMNVTVDAAGRVLDAEIVRPSSSRVLDQRAVAIVQAASPFGPFTSAMRGQADQIVVTSRFRFTREDGLEATVGTAR